MRIHANKKARQAAYRKRKVLAKASAAALAAGAEPWITSFCSIQSPGKPTGPIIPYPYQTTLWADTSRQRIVLKSRQMGMSRAVACEAAYIALTRPGSTVLLVSRGLIAARNLLRYVWQSI